MKPGSVWLNGYLWMSEDLHKVRKDDIIKHVENIILSNDKKKIVKKDLLYNEFDATEVEAVLFTLVNVEKIDKNLVLERIKVGDIYSIP